MLKNIVPVRELLLRVLQEQGPSTIADMLKNPLIVVAQTKREYLYKILPRMEEAKQIERIPNSKPQRYQIYIEKPKNYKLVSPTLKSADKLKIGEEEKLSPQAKSIVSIINDKRFEPFSNKGLRIKDKNVDNTFILLKAAKALLLAENQETLILFLQDVVHAVQFCDTMEPQAFKEIPTDVDELLE